MINLYSCNDNYGFFGAGVGHGVSRQCSQAVRGASANAVQYLRCDRGDPGGFDPTSGE